jgi:hypothetical protein
MVPHEFPDEEIAPPGSDQEGEDDVEVGALFQVESQGLEALEEEGDPEQGVCARRHVGFRV